MSSYKTVFSCLFDFIVFFRSLSSNFNAPQEKWDVVVKNQSYTYQAITQKISRDYRTRIYLLDFFKISGNQLFFVVVVVAVSFVMLLTSSINVLKSLRATLVSRNILSWYWLRRLSEKDTHCVKGVRIRSYSSPYFPTFGLNTERLRISPC